MTVSMKERRRAEPARNSESGENVYLCLHLERKRRNESVLMITAMLRGVSMGSVSRNSTPQTGTGTVGRDIGTNGSFGDE